MFKTLFTFTSLLLLLSGNIYSANYYVSKSSTGNGNGADWSNAATAVSRLNWSIIRGGDSIYVSGGNDSMTYPHDSVYNKYISKGVVTITNGKDAGHNGKVIYLADKTYASAFAFGIMNSHNIKVTGITFKWLIDNAHKYISTVYIYGSGNCTIDNSHIINDGHGMTLMVNTDTSISITNNYIEYLSNSYMDNTAQNDQDGMDFQHGAGGHTIKGNSIIQRGLNGGSWHIDGMQWYQEGSNLNLQSEISDNFFYYNAPTATGTNAAIYINSTNYSNRLLIYNNIIVSNTTQMDGFQFSKNSSYHLSVQMYNNTMLLGSQSAAALVLGALDTLIMKNNIIINDLTSSKEILMMDPNQIGYFKTDYNQWFCRNRQWNNWNGSAEQTFSQWQSLGFDTHSKQGDVTFLKKGGANPNDYQLTSNSSGINAGTTISLTSTAFDGTLRPQGSAYDVGAFEFATVTSLPVELSLFRGNYSNKTVQLSWETATEINNRGFEIERNSNSGWEKIGFIEGKGSTLNKSVYSFEDKAPVGLTIQYRLKQIDNDGSFKYSDVVSVTAAPDDFTISNYPNPFNPSTKIRYSLPFESMVNIIVYNVVGEKIDELKNEVQQSGSYEINWSGANHASGVYLLAITQSPMNGSSKSSKVIKMNLIK